MNTPLDPLAALQRRALRLLAVRPRSEEELRARLLAGTRGSGPVDPARVEELLARLRRRGLLDDRRLAGEVARSRLAWRQEGLRRVREELRGRGVEAETAATAAAAAAQEAGGEQAILERALNKRLRVEGPPRDRRGLARLYRWLLGRGHPPAAVLALLEAHFPEAFSNGG